MVHWARWSHKYHTTALTRGGISAGARGGRLCSYATVPGYTTLRKDRPPYLGKGGGLCIAVKTSIAYSEVTTVSHTAMEAMGIKLNDLHLFNIYNPPGTNLDQQFFNQLTGCRIFIIGGDFNSRHSLLGSPTSNAAERYLFFFIENNDFVVLNTSTPTHFSFTRLTMWGNLDLAIASRSIACNCSTEITKKFLGSDHSIISIQINHVQPALDNSLPRWLLCKANWSDFVLFVKMNFRIG